MTYCKTARLGLIVLVVSIALVMVSTLLAVDAIGAASITYTAESLKGTAQDEVQVSVAEAVSCPASMIAYWSFDETAGTVFAESIQGNDASCSGDSCPLFATGRVFGALAFDGVDDQVTAPHLPDFEWLNDDSFSVELWVKTTDCDNSVFFGKHSHGPNWWLGCSFNRDLPAFAIRDTVLTESVRIVGPTTIGDGEWHHLVGVRDAATQENRLYVDGALAASETVQYTGDFNNTSVLTFGYHFDRYFANATIDEVAAYNTALTAQEILDHYNAGLAGTGYCNKRPQAANGSYVTDVDTSVLVTLSYTDLDGPGPYTVQIIDEPNHGGLSGSNTSYTYTPDLGYEGPDSFTWLVNDGLNDSNIATVGLLVTEGGANIPPIAEASEPVTISINATTTLQLNYSDPDNGPGPYVISITDAPDHGNLSGTGAVRVYTPDIDFAGDDAFTWHVNDGLANSNSVTVNIHVNSRPVANSAQYETAMNTAVSIQLGYTDPDNGPGPYSFEIVQGPGHGALTGSGANRMYTPAAGFAGSDSFTWRLYDGLDYSNVATITVKVVDESNGFEDIYIYLPVMYGR